MDIRKIRKLIELMEETDISEIEIKEGEESLKLSRHHSGLLESSIRHTSSPQQFIHHTSSAMPQPSIAAEEKKALAPPVVSGFKIRSPMVGTMYTSPSPESPPFVTIGQVVKAGDVLMHH